VVPLYRVLFNDDDDDLWL